MDYKTDTYGCGPDKDGVYTVEEFKNYCKSGVFIDYGGYGCAVKDECCMQDDEYFIDVYPSIVGSIPEDATHVIWFNK